MALKTLNLLIRFKCLVRHLKMPDKMSTRASTMAIQFFQLCRYRRAAAIPQMTCISITVEIQRKLRL